MGLLTNLFACIRESKEERDFNTQLRKDGLTIAVSRCIQEINEIIPSKEVAIKFVLQELDFAQKEEEFPKEFILNSGFHQLEYKDALDRFQESEPELLKVQIKFDDFLRKIKNKEEMIQISIDILDHVMERWEIGKYSSARRTPQEREVTEPEPEIQEEKPIIEEIKEPKAVLQYDSNRVNQLMEEYSDIIGDIIIGTVNPTEATRIEEFKEHISLASLEGQSDHALVLSCFYEHKEPYDDKLPIKISEMNDVALNFFRSIVKGFSQQGFSQAFLDYMEENREQMHLLK